MAAALCRRQDHGFRVSRGASLRERRMSPPPEKLQVSSLQFAEGRVIERYVGEVAEFG